MAKTKTERKKTSRVTSWVSCPSRFELCGPSPHLPATLQCSPQPLRDGSFSGPSLYHREQLAIGRKNLYFQKSGKRDLYSGHDYFFFPSGALTQWLPTYKEWSVSLGVWWVSEPLSELCSWNLRNQSIKEEDSAGPLDGVSFLHGSQGWDA